MAPLPGVLPSHGDRYSCRVVLDGEFADRLLRAQEALLPLQCAEVHAVPCTIFRSGNRLPLSVRAFLKSVPEVIHTFAFASAIWAGVGS